MEHRDGVSKIFILLEMGNSEAVPASAHALIMTSGTSDGNKTDSITAITDARAMAAVPHSAVEPNAPASDLLKDEKKTEATAIREVQPNASEFDPVKESTLLADAPDSEAVPASAPASTITSGTSDEKKSDSITAITDATAMAAVPHSAVEPNAPASDLPKDEKKTGATAIREVRPNPAEFDAVKESTLFADAPDSSPQMEPTPTETTPSKPDFTIPDTPEDEKKTEATAVHDPTTTMPRAADAKETQQIHDASTHDPSKQPTPIKPDSTVSNSSTMQSLPTILWATIRRVACAYADWVTNGFPNARRSRAEAEKAAAEVAEVDAAAAVVLKEAMRQSDERARAYVERQREIVRAARLRREDSIIVEKADKWIAHFDQTISWQLDKLNFSFLIVVEEDGMNAATREAVFWRVVHYFQQRYPREACRPAPTFHWLDFNLRSVVDTSSR